YDRSPRLLRREQELLKNHGKKWAGPLGRLPQVTWRRGFVDAVGCSLERFVKEGEAILGHAPITEVALSRLRALTSLANCPALARVRRLHLGGGGVPVSGLAALARSRHARGLTALTLPMG